VPDGVLLVLVVVTYSFFVSPDVKKALYAATLETQLQQRMVAVLPG
jgi:hypothetical protein